MPKNIKVYFSHFPTLPLPAGHSFPAEKYGLLKHALVQQQVLSRDELLPASPVDRQTVLLAHQPEYFDSICDGSIDPRVMRRIGLPWSEDLIIRVLHSMGGTLDAAREALKDGISGNLGGGTHHACAESGQGFCVFNDVAIAVLYLLKHQMIKKAAIIDLDAHQGNGNSALLGNNPAVFILSLHGQKTFPIHKVPSTVDVGLPSGCDDLFYMDSLKTALPRVMDFGADIIFYLAGVDPLKQDRFGKLGLSMAGLAERDRLVLEHSKGQCVPVCLVMGGGYAVPIDVTVQAHVQTYRIVKQIFSS